MADYIDTVRVKDWSAGEGKATRVAAKMTANIKKEVASFEARQDVLASFGADNEGNKPDTEVSAGVSTDCPGLLTLGLSSYENTYSHAG